MAERHRIGGPQIPADEPVLYRTGPHWVSQDLTVLLAGTTALVLVVAVSVDPSLWRLALLPGIPLALRVAVDLPRYWRFETVVTTRRVFVNVGVVRDVYHTLQLRHVQSIEVRENPLGRLLGFGEVTIELEGVSPDGKTHSGVYLLDYVRHPCELRDAIVDAVERVWTADPG